MGRGDKAFVEDGGHQEKLGFKLSTNLVANFGSRCCMEAISKNRALLRFTFPWKERLSTAWVLPDAGGLRWFRFLSLLS